LPINGGLMISSITNSAFQADLRLVAQVRTESLTHCIVSRALLPTVA
jgi:hypothetical protein